jgi:hypothetical protein
LDTIAVDIRRLYPFAGHSPLYYHYPRFSKSKLYFGGSNIEVLDYNSYDGGVFLIRIPVFRGRESS